MVVNYANSASAAEAVVEEIKRLGGDGVAVQADMSTQEGIKSLFKATSDAFEEPVGVLVNNAGITRDTLVLRMKPDQWNDVIDTNLNGVFFASQAAEGRSPSNTITIKYPAPSAYPARLHPHPQAQPNRVPS